ncbi:MAG: hypothetical protein QXS96_06110 [Candidatus Caldarchaeum sp.]
MSNEEIDLLFERELRELVARAVDRGLQQWEERRLLREGRLFERLTDLWVGKSMFPWSFTWPLRMRKGGIL